MKRFVGRTLAVLAVGTAFTGCSRFSHSNDAADTGAAEPAVSASAAPANTEVVANESSVKRYSDEKALDQIPTIVEAAFVDPRTEAGMGDVVDTVPRNTSARPVAQKGAYVLIQFTDPKDATRMLEGWVLQTTLKPHTTAHTGPIDGGSGDAAKPATPVTPPGTPTTPTTPTTPIPATTGYSFSNWYGSNGTLQGVLRIAF